VAGGRSEIEFQLARLSTVFQQDLGRNANPCQRAGDTFRLMIAQIWPASFTIGPPSDPGFTAAVVSIANPA
jgi:hypothetical protein